MGGPQKAAHAIACLASDEARFVTGAFLFVDGDESRRPGHRYAYDLLILTEQRKLTTHRTDLTTLSLGS